MSEREIHFKLIDESVKELDKFKEKHGFSTDFEAILSMVQLTFSMEASENFSISFLRNGSINIEVKGQPQ